MVNIKFDLPKVQEIELGVHSVWCQWGFWQHSLAPEPWGFLCPLFCLHMEGRQRKKGITVISVGWNKVTRRIVHSQWTNVDMVSTKFLTQNQIHFTTVEIQFKPLLQCWVQENYKSFFINYIQMAYRAETYYSSGAIRDTSPCILENSGLTGNRWT